MHYPDYPFTPKRFELRPGIAMSYLDEGPRDGEVVLMLHGNPSWSYYWRKLVGALSDRWRCIVPDHVGMGLSDKPDDAAYAYTLQSRIDDVASLLEHLGITGRVTLAVHDWGGMIGFGWALRDADRVARMVILNTAAFPLPAEKPMPWQLRLGRDSRLGALAIRGLNAFSSAASFVGVEQRMPSEVRAAYVAPYDSWAHRIATLRFVQDIPLGPEDRAWRIVEESGRRLGEFADRPALLVWGLCDFVFDAHFLRGFEQRLPNAESLIFDDAGHYVLEDKAAVIVPRVRDFLERHPL
ncbi:MAG: alpha/beta fold hydrolase [Chiayiivirga sp.]|jgi:haloalkane dehalogenase|uniref:Alpha/beta fold hydrolase n=1 Tax=Denitratimonas tolerans TaxID=1338420 RepID=A0AAW9R5D5_9GAMM|nr:alpha/beta fold hydrolase [Chiayiivirga sp.]HMN34169.1 alpha/beta fold hydrolase [Chiayiivirga sp.]HRQ35729.1 alpha/beta fold hydrolase [Chiayiivirga sp.]